MDNVIIKNEENQTDNGQTQFIGNYIVAAMDIEDKILDLSYSDYLDRNKWPEALDEKVFESIIKILTPLIEDTMKHHRKFLDLQSRLSSKHTNMNKDDIISDFETLKLFEESTRNFYLKVYTDPEVHDETVRKVFKSVAEDEQRHVKAVEKLLSIIKNSLY